MLTMLDLFALLGTAFPWMQRAQLRRLERIGERVPFSDESREVIERAYRLAHVEGARVVDPVHLAMAALASRTHAFPATGVTGEQQVALDTTPVVTDSLPFTNPAFRVLVEAVRVAVDTHRATVTPDHILLGILRRRPKRAATFLAERGVTLERVATVADHVHAPWLPMRRPPQ